MNIQWQIVCGVVACLLFGIGLYKGFKERKARNKHIDRIRKRYKKIIGKEID